MKTGVIVDNNGTVFTPWTDGYAVGFEITKKDDPSFKEYIYLNPSSETTGTSDVFLYQGIDGSPGSDGPHCFYVVGEAYT